MKSKVKDTVLITSATTQTGASWAKRFASSGHNLILVARDFTELEVLAWRLWSETGVNVEIEVADLGNLPDLRRVEHRLAFDQRIGVFVNNAEHDAGVLAATRLATSAAYAFAERNSGSIINLASAPEAAEILAFSETLNAQVGQRGVQVQAALPEDDVVAFEAPRRKFVPSLFRSSRPAA